MRRHLLIATVAAATVALPAPALAAFGPIGPAHEAAAPAPASATEPLAPVSEAPEATAPAPGTESVPAQTPPAGLGTQGPEATLPPEPPSTGEDDPVVSRIDGGFQAGDGPASDEECEARASIINMMDTIQGVLMDDDPEGNEGLIMELGGQRNTLYTEGGERGCAFTESEEGEDQE